MKQQLQVAGSVGSWFPEDGMRIVSSGFLNKFRAAELMEPT